MFYSLYNKQIDGYVAINRNTIDSIVVKLDSKLRRKADRSIGYTVYFYVGERKFETASWSTECNERLARLMNVDFDQAKELVSELFTCIFNDNADKSMVEMMSIFNNELYAEGSLLDKLGSFAGSDY